MARRQLVGQIEMNNTIGPHSSALPTVGMFATFQSISRLCAVTLVAIAVAVLVGWAFNLELIKRIVPGLPAMNPATAVGFILSGGALFAKLVRPSRLSNVLAAFAACLVIVIGGLQLWNYLFPGGLRIDHLMFRAKVESEPLGPNRMAPNTAFGFILAGLAILLLDVETRRGRRPSQYLAGGLGILSLLATLGYAYGMKVLYGIAAYMPIALHTATLFIVLAFGLFLARPDRGAMIVLGSRSAGGVMARRLLPTVLIIPSLLGALRIAGERAGLYDNEFGTVLVVVCMVTLLVALIGFTSSRLHRADEKRANTEIALRTQSEQLAEQAEILGSVLRCMGDGVVVADTNGKFLIWNPAAERLIGMGAKDVPMERWSETYGNYRGEEKTPCTTEQLPSVRAIRGEAVDADLLFIHNEKTAPGLWISVTSRPLIGQTGAIRGGVAVFHDVTERKNAREALQKAHDELERRVEERTAELQRSNKELEQFAYVASHDLQQPLRMVTSYVQLLEHRYKDKFDAEAREFIEQVVQGAARMKCLINDLLTYSRAGAGEFKPEPRNCERVLAQTLRLLEKTMQDTGATVTHDPLPTVLADETQMIQLFQNLIDNAIKYRSDRPSIVHVSAERRGPDWLFSVSDNGIGIDPQYAERIFLIFQRLHGRDKYPGTGIGLAICKRVVERHGGRLWMEPNAKEGTTFFFTLPFKEIAVHETNPTRTTHRDLVGGGRPR